MVEIFEDDVLYQARYADQFRPDYMKDPIDFYLVNKIVPKVIRYQVGIFPVLNGVFIDYSPILFETGDHLDIKYSIQRYGPVDFNTYMRFLHEAYKSEKLNMDNDFAGNWSFMVWKQKVSDTKVSKNPFQLKLFHLFLQNFLFLLFYA